MEGGPGLHLQSAVRWSDENKYKQGHYGRREEENHRARVVKDRSLEVGDRKELGVTG